VGAPRIVLISICAIGLAACGDNAVRIPRTISLDPGSPKLAAGIMLDVKASYVAADQTATEAADATWAVDDATVATVMPGTSGHATLLGVNAGTTTLTVASSGAHGTFTVTVTPAVLTNVSITPTDPSLAAGTSVQLTATGVFSDKTSLNVTRMVTWKSSALGTAAVDSDGLLHGAIAGTVTVSATLAKVTAIANVTVTSATLRSISVTPIDPNLPLGIHQQFTATGVFSNDSTQDLTRQVTWSSDTEASATVDADGMVIAVARGPATIQATKSGISGTSRATVTPAVLASVAIEPASPGAAAGRTQQLTAFGTFTDGLIKDLTGQAVWSSDTSAIATVDNDADKGLVSAVAKGSAEITARVNGIPGSTTFTVTDAVLVSIQVTPIAPTIITGTTQPFIARGTFSDTSTQDLTTQVLWESSDPDIAEISNADPTRGLATGKAAGTVTITATLDGIDGTRRLTVSDATVVDIQLAPVDDSLAVGFTVSYTATGVLSDGTHQPLTDDATWTSSDPWIAGISDAPDSKGQARALHDGTVTIRAAFGGVTGSTQLTVTPAVLQSIAVTPVDPQLPLGHSLGFAATGTFSDGPRDITTQVGWSVSPGGIATISNLDGSQGAATAVAPGTTTVTATFPGATPITGSTSLTVSAAELVSIDVTPATTDQVVGAMLQYTATGNYTDDSTQDLTTQVDWASDNAAVAIDPLTGRAFAAAVGSATISATFTTTAGSVVGHATFHVIAPTAPAR
jgi:hypothetical protein